MDEQLVVDNAKAVIITQDGKRAHLRTESRPGYLGFTFCGMMVPSGSWVSDEFYANDKDRERLFATWPLCKRCEARAFVLGRGEVKAGDGIKLADDVGACGVLAGAPGKVLEVGSGEVRIYLEPSKTTRWIGREFWANPEIVKLARG